MKIKIRPSPNFNERTGVLHPDMILIHYTGMRTAAEALDRLCDSAAEVSAHYVIDEDGTIYNLVLEDKRAWHAGKSYWQGERDINAHSIGIELVNPGHEFGYRAFPVRQIAALGALCRDIRARHEISPFRILGHADVAPARKEDPGELFPWQMLAQAGLGVWPAIVEADAADAATVMSSPARQRSALAAYGYDPDVALETVITAFQRHFHPEAFAGIDPQPGTMTLEAALRLAALLRMAAGEEKLD